MKKTYILALILALALPVYASDVRGTVRDNNNGEEGFILMHSGEVQGQYNDAGTWTDAEFLRGEDGADGQDGINGADGTDGQAGTNGINGEVGNNGIDGVNGTNGIDGANGQDGKGLKNQYKAGVDFRVLDTRKTAWNIYYNSDFNNQIDEVGVKITIKLGKSYEERKIEELEKKLAETP